MPTYQYVCTNPDGKHEFELVQSFTDDPATECTVCGAPVRKVYGSVGVVFKGSGFYRTDSRAAANGSSNGSSESSSKSESSKPEGAKADSSKSGPSKSESTSTSSSSASSSSSSSGSSSGSKAAS